MQARALFLLALVASASAFTAAPGLALRPTQRTAAISNMKMGFSPTPSPEGMGKDTYWEGKAPSSEVLGIGKDVSSGNYIVASVVAAIVGGYCTGQTIPLTINPNPIFIAGSFFLPYSWALHVAGWIQKNNGK